jgi:hypothetical protein
VYGGLAIGPLTYIVRGRASLTSTTLVNAFMKVMRDTLLIAFGPSMLTASHKQASALVADIQPVLAALVAESLAAAAVPTLFSATLTAPIDTATRTQLNRVLVAAALPSVLSQAVFAGALPLLSHLPPRLTHATHILMRAKPLTQGAAVAVHSVFPFSDDLSAEPVPASASASAPAPPPHSLVVLRLQRDISVVLLVEGPGAAPEFQLLGRELASVVAEAGLALPHALPAPALPEHVKQHVLAVAAVAAGTTQSLTHVYTSHLHALSPLPPPSPDACIYHAPARNPALPRMLAAAVAAAPQDGAVTIRQQGESITHPHNAR